MSIKKDKNKREWIPPWQMPSDPVKAVFWFMQWLLIVLVRFFWIPIIGMVIYEIIINSQVGGIVNILTSGAITLLVGLVVWAILYGILALIRVSTTISHTISDVNRLQQTFTERNRSQFTGFKEREREDRVVEGTITDLEEERRKRRRE